MTATKVSLRTSTQGETTITTYTLTNSNMKAVLMDYGATLTHLYVPTSSGLPVDVVLGFDDVFAYRRVGRGQNPYFGATIGRSCNRTAKGGFRLDGQQYSLPANNGSNSLHGGIEGFDKRLWTGNVVDSTAVCFRLESEDGDEGYPGRLAVQVTYTLLPNALKVDFKANLLSGIATYVNLTNHSYFNLSGMRDKTIGDHLVQTNAIKGVLELDECQIPTGKLMELSADDPFYFPPSDKPGFEALKRQVKGFDHFYVIDKPKSNTESQLDTAIFVVHSKTTGITMAFHTDAYGTQFYTGNFLDGSLGPKQSQINAYAKHSGFCLEPSAPPDAINHDEWAHLVKVTNQKPWTQSIVYKFTNH